MNAQVQFAIHLPAHVCVESQVGGNTRGNGLYRPVQRCVQKFNAAYKTRYLVLSDFMLEYYEDEQAYHVENEGGQTHNNAYKKRQVQIC